jgi:hypothetical protein
LENALLGSPQRTQRTQRGQEGFLQDGRGGKDLDRWVVMGWSYPVNWPLKNRMASYDLSQIRDISRQFQIYGDLHHVEPCKIGHINETYIATYNQGGASMRYIHQKLNTEVFRNPDAVMHNIQRVTQHQRRKLEAAGQQPR